MKSTTWKNRGRSAAAALAIGLGVAAPAMADGSSKAIEQALAAAQEARKGVTLYVAGQSIGGGVVKIEPGQWVELRSQQFGRIVVRIERIDGVAMP
jgi:predicted alpha/beta hydrolase